MRPLAPGRQDHRRSGEPFWSAPIETVLAEFGGRPDGLTQREADRQLLTCGPNRSSDTRAITPLGLLLNQFRSPLVLLLLFAMTLSLFLGETTDGVIVLAIVLGSALLGFMQEYRASNAIAKLLAVVQTRVTVLRDGHEVELPQDALVPGDVIVLVAGAAVPADCRIPPFDGSVRRRIHVDGRELPFGEGGRSPSLRDATRETIERAVPGIACGERHGPGRAW